MADIRADPKQVHEMSPDELIAEAQRSSKRVERKSRAFAQEVAHLRDVLAALGIGFELVATSPE